jgi:dCTP deaminase
LRGEGRNKICEPLYKVGELVLLMNKEAILEVIRSQRLKITDFKPEDLGPASYDAHFGRRAFSSSGKTKIKVDDKGSFILEPGDFGVVTTLEKFELPLDIAAQIGIRSHYARKGIIHLSGPQIDPGFRGVLVVGLFNASSRSIIFPYKEPFVTLEFVKLLEPAKEGYKGPYQDQEDIPTADMEWLAETTGMSFAQVITTLGTLNSSVTILNGTVQSLKDSMTRMQWLVGIALVAIGILVGISRFY